MPDTDSAVTAPTRFVKVDGRKLAYRCFGAGTALVLCLRFRGVMDDWAPAFLDGLAHNGFRVIVFDYGGLGRSSGERSYDPSSLAKDLSDLMDGLGLEKAVIAGWSIGGIAAQMLFASAPLRVSHLVLIGAMPPGPLVKTGDARHYAVAKRENGFDDMVTLFFEPRSTFRRAAAERSAKRLALRQTDRSPAVPIAWAAAQVGDQPANPAFPADPALRALETATLPILYIGSDNDVFTPVENWQALIGSLPTLHVLTLPL